MVSLLGSRELSLSSIPVEEEENGRRGLTYSLPKEHVTQRKDQRQRPWGEKGRDLFKEEKAASAKPRWLQVGELEDISGRQTGTGWRGDCKTTARNFAFILLEAMGELSAGNWLAILSRTVPFPRSFLAPCHWFRWNHSSLYTLPRICKCRSWQNHTVY